VSAAQDETFSPQNIIVLGVLLFIALFLGEVVIGPHSDDDVMAMPVDTMEDIAMRLKPVVSLEDMRNNMSVASAAGDSASKSPDQLYQGACLACHSTGAAGAPKIGEAAAWTARVAKGLDSLVKSAINGLGAMPPRGGSQYSDDQMRAVIEYILDESK
jgi:cytochrome c5